MVFITIELIRKRSEHNEGEIGTLEEISLHQEDIEKIEHLGQWCRHLKIILLQSNLIAKLENLNKLKELEYLNVAINNIERIENLERCETLKKLDLTLNFIGELTSVESLQNNIHLQELYLTGNPCCDYVGYRKYVVATLPQLEILDNTNITRSERIVALQEYDEICHVIERQQKEQAISRSQQRERMVQWTAENEHYDKDNDEENAKFWRSSCEHAPETRSVIAKRSRREAPVFGGTDPPAEPKMPPKFFAPNGRPYNINEAKVPFKFDTDDPEKFTLDIQVYKYLDTDLVSVDLEINYVRVIIKGKILQIALPEEIQIDNSTVIRSAATGRLVITMAVLHPKSRISGRNYQQTKRITKELTTKNKYQGQMSEISKREYLEIGPADNKMDFSQIVMSKRKTFVDNPEVPPLE